MLRCPDRCHLTRKSGANIKDDIYMKIAIDGRVLMNPPTGIANVLINALNELSRQKPAWSFYVLTNRDINKQCLKRINKTENLYTIKRAFTDIGVLWYCTRLYFMLKELSPDYFWAPTGLLPPKVPKGVRTLLTIHDMVAKDYRETMSLVGRLYNILYFAKSICNADILWSNSEYTRKEIELRYDDRKIKDVFVGCGVDRTIFKKIYLDVDEKQSILNKYNLNCKFILFVGTVEPRKNVSFLLSLIPKLSQKGFTCLIVGAKGWGDRKGINKIFESADFPKSKVIFSGFVDTCELIKLYNMASVYVSTSLNEGFGLPQLEAMNCGCPVVSAHNSAMIEVVEGAGRTVEGWNIDEWIETIEEVFENRNEYIRLGYLRAEKYCWTKTMSDLSKVIEAKCT